MPGLALGGTAPSPQVVLLDQQAGLRAGGSRPAPDLVGLGFHEAHALAAAAHLRLSVSVWETSVGPWGRILDQRPSPGERVRRGARIRITVSGRPREQVPDVTGLPLGDAIERLVWLGFVPLAELRQSSSLVSAGHVVSTRPAPGALLDSGSVVALTVARAQRERTTRPVSARAGVR